MPLYEYKCASCGKTFEVIQKFADEPLKTHPECGGEVERLFSAPAFHLKGTGWYATDYGKKSGSSSDSKSKDARSEESHSTKNDHATSKHENSNSDNSDSKSKTDTSSSSDSKSSSETKSSSEPSAKPSNAA